MRLWTLGSVLIPSVALAQVALGPPLDSTRSWRCEFPTIASNDWLGIAPSPRIDTQQFFFHIDNVDVAGGSARMIGDVGSDDLGVLRGAGVLHFVEVTPSGNFHVTTIFAASAGAGQLKATHSRHVLILGDPLPSQAYGHCRPWE